VKHAMWRGAWMALALALAPVLPSLAVAEGTLSALQTDVDQLARRARPAVVTVLALRTEMRRIRAERAAVPRTHMAVGSGVAVEENGVLTTASVVQNAERVLVQTANGIQADAEVVGVDPIFNLALLRVPTVRLPTVRFASDRIDIGDWAIALGTSYGAQPTQSVGNVAYLYREPRLVLLQLTNTVYPGNSGAPALNARGELIGLVQGELGSPDPGGTAPESERRPGGASFLQPVEIIRPVYESLRREGRVHHGFLGVSTKAASVESQRADDPVPIGAQVEAVEPGGPAAQAGLKRGDLIVAFDRERVEYPEQLARWVAASPPGAITEMVWVRDEIQHVAKVTLGESPQAVPQWLARRSGEGGGSTSPDRIAELERQVRRLSDELQRLRPRGGAQAITTSPR